MIQESILLQPHRTVVANFAPGNFGLFRRNLWQPRAYARWVGVKPPLELDILQKFYYLPKGNYVFAYFLLVNLST